MAATAPPAFATAALAPPAAAAARAPAVPPAAEVAATAPPAFATAAGLRPAAGPAIAPTLPEVRTATALVPDRVTAPPPSSIADITLAAAKPAGTAPPVIPPAGDRAAPATPPSARVVAGVAAGLAMRDRAPDAVALTSSAIAPPGLRPATIPSAAAPEARQAAQVLPPQAPGAPPAPQVAPAGEPVTAALSFSAAGAAPLSEAALDAVQAFLVPDPGDAAQALRDGIAQRLDGVDCARVQTAFDPETGSLELRGHVPRTEDRARLAAAIAAELGGALPVVDRLLELPRPQCDVLGGLEAAGIAQSTEQFTNPLIIGEDTHARVYSFRAGDAMRLDIGGADYDGWLYLDYYDSAGDVLHLAPNAAVPPVWLPARTAARFGGGGAEDVSGGRVRLQIGPPFGKDIAVALVASRPLFDDLRPTREPAADYLAALGQRIADLRQRTPGFKAEWVYLFVSTAP